MNLNPAFTRTAARYVLLAGLIIFAGSKLIEAIPQGLAIISVAARIALLTGLIFIGLKLIAAIIQILLPRYQRGTGLFRTVYIVGKVTPALAAAAFCVSAILQHDRERIWVYGLLAVFAAFLAVLVVRLRSSSVLAR
jgi:hypothetical protein